MKMTKKQMIVSSVMALVLVGGGVGVVAHHQAQVRADKIAQEAKQTHDKLINDAEEATQKAETFKAEADVKTAQDAIKKLEEKDKAPFITRVEKVDRNWTLVHKAEQAVIKAEKGKTETSVKMAQTAIDQLKATMTKTKKSALQQRLDKVKAIVKNNKAKAEKAKKAKKAKEAKEAQAEAQVQTQAQNQQVAVQKSETPSGTVANNEASQGEVSSNASAPVYQYQAPVSEQAAPSYNAPASAPAQSSNNTGNPAYNSGAGKNANPNVSMEEADKDIADANAHPYGDGMSVNGGR
ncbi:serine protease [Lactococcus petauri]|uniref:serine protease n=1 Tax=Lactococcus petauri TaxID=1940789 RepID=UPI001F59B2FD|nr:serine protease [Lactococcus petauri]